MERTDLYSTYFYCFGTFFIALACFFHLKKIEIKNQTLAIFFLGVSLVLFPYLKPSSIKVGDFHLELKNIKERIKPFAVLNLKESRVEYTTLNKTEISNILAKNRGDSGEIFFTLNQKPFFLKADYNGIETGNYGNIFSEIIEKDGKYTVHLKYVKYSMEGKSIAKIPPPEKLILEIIGNGDL